jgi:hypothetical protein
VHLNLAVYGICSESSPNELSKILLEKAYEGTYLTGIITHAPVIVLTLIGGGVFNNSLSLIIGCIMKNHNKCGSLNLKHVLFKNHRR